jgi:hypothetical protein
MGHRVTFSSNRKDDSEQFRAAALGKSEDRASGDNTLKTLSSSNPSTKKESINNHRRTDEWESDITEGHLIAITVIRYIVRTRGVTDG